MRVEKQCVRYGIFSHAFKRQQSHTVFLDCQTHIGDVCVFGAARLSIFGSGMDLRLTIIPSYFCFTRS